MLRRTRLPDDVRAALDLPRGERPLAAGALAPGGWAVATTAELAVVDAGGAVVVRRPWAQVARAAYDPQRQAVTVEWVDRSPDTRLVLPDVDRSALPLVVRERVQWSVVLAEEVALPGGRSARVAVRRAADGTLFSQALAGRGVDLDAPDVAPLVDAAEDRVRAAAGLPL
ncbi:hypothetical protein [Puerhibacterium sp. TATVAM-FAB25]|uniref:hypothetical protein n=1 Tax=Puerhibacterium sp. TATVAM-FAB25 TaxID=3093699 RepID=UPI00397C27F6